MKRKKPGAKRRKTDPDKQKQPDIVVYHVNTTYFLTLKPFSDMKTIPGMGALGARKKNRRRESAK